MGWGTVFKSQYIYKKKIGRQRNYFDGQYHFSVCRSGYPEEQDHRKRKQDKNTQNNMQGFQCV